MDKFFDKFKETYIWPSWGPFFPFLGQNFFKQNSSFVTHDFIIVVIDNFISQLRAFSDTPPHMETWWQW